MLRDLTRRLFLRRLDKEDNNRSYLWGNRNIIDRKRLKGLYVMVGQVTNISVPIILYSLIDLFWR